MVGLLCTLRFGIMQLSFSFISFITRQPESEVEITTILDGLHTQYVVPCTLLLLLSTYEPHASTMSERPTTSLSSTTKHNIIHKLQWEPQRYCDPVDENRTGGKCMIAYKLQQSTLSQRTYHFWVDARGRARTRGVLDSTQTSSGLHVIS